MSPTKTSPANPARHPSPATGSLPVTRKNDTFHIVALGASAGGLEALEEFFENMPADSGMGFVVIQHLDPNRKALMPELLQRVTSMKVRQVKDKTRVQPNNIYILPPNKDMSVMHGVLHLFDPPDERGHRLPIDGFFTSLARDRKKHAIAIVLSGMGSDGSQGLREIREHGGLTLAQAPKSAKFDSMPRSAIDANLVDLVRPAKELPSILQTFLKHPGLLPVKPPTGAKGPGIEKALILLRDRTGHDFSVYKINTIQRRIERRMLIHHIDTLEVYVRYLQENPGEVELLFKELFIGVTQFFRDPVVWERLKDVLTPVIQAHAEAGSTFRAWIAGCSTGEEAYTVAMVIREVLDAREEHREMGLRIFASDLDRDAIEKARKGRFSENISADLSPERLEKFFVQEEDASYRVRPEIRADIFFSVHSLINDPPFTRLDLVCCRNVLIYLTSEMQEKLIPLFHYSLHPGGILLLGRAESLGIHSHLLADVDGPLRIHRKLKTAYTPDFIDFPTRDLNLIPPERSEIKRPPPMRQNLQTLAETVILQQYAPATVLVDELGNILHISGRTGKYLEPAAGKANWNLFAMTREGLRTELHRCFTKAMAKPGLAHSPGLCLEEEGLKHYVDLGVERLTEPDPLAGMLIVLFHTAAPPPSKQTTSKTTAKGKNGATAARLADLETALEEARAELRKDQEEMQRYRQDLRATIEELQSTNEELQSSNEELTTSKEEMQSLNEELQTVNAELQEKLDERARISTKPKRNQTT